MTPASPATSTTRSTTRTRTRALAVVAAVLANLALWAVAVPLLGVDLAARPGAGAPVEVTAVAVAAATLLPALLGWGLLALLERTTRRGLLVWTALAVAVVLLSCLSPLVGGVTTGAKVVLVLMHLVAGAVIVPAMRRSSPQG